MFTGMKKHNSLIVPILLILSSAAYAAGYLDRLRGIDQSVLCVVVWFAPATVVVLFALGGFLYSTGNLTNRTLGKSYMQNSLAGLFLVVAFIGLAFAMVPSLKIDPCLGESPAEKKCADKAGWSCGCPDGKVCEAGSAISDATDCASSTCCKCVDKSPVAKRCIDQSYTCGCTDPQICKEEDASIIGCEGTGKNCCKKCEAPITLEKCMSFKYIHVKVVPGATPGLAQFHSFEGGDHEGFQVTQDYYDGNNVCGVFIIDKISWGTDAAGILWAAKLKKLNKDGSSIGGDLGGSYHLCGAGEFGNPPCKCETKICGSYADSTEYGPLKVIDQAYGPATVSKEGLLGTENGDVSLSESETSYKPKYDILCGEDKKWHACDKTGCECVSNYACENGKWINCDHGCDSATGKCKSN